MMLYGEAVRGVRPWAVTNEGDIWLTQRRADGTVYALVDLENNRSAFTLKSVRATPDTKVSLLGQEGELEWKATPAGLQVTVQRKQTIRLVKAPPKPGEGPASVDKQVLRWGPDWPVAVKLTNVRPNESGGR
jgi:alpha-L-fucosidase